MTAPVYKVNPQTGDVVKDDGSGWKPVVSARNKQTGQIVVDEGAGWGQLVRSQDGSWSLASQAPSNPQASAAAGRARGAMDAGLPIDREDLSTLTKPNFQPLTPAQQAFAETSQARVESGAFEDQRRREADAIRVPDSNLKERSLMAVNGPTWGNAPRLMAGMQTVGALAATPFVDGDIIDRKGIGGATEQFLDDARVHQARAREERPVESLALEIVPALFQGKTLFDAAGKHLLKKKTLLNNTARAVGTGAAGGATYMASQNESATPEGVLDDAKTGAMWGAAGGLAFKGAEMPVRVAYRSAKTAGASIYDALASALGKKAGARDAVAEQVAVAAVNRSADRAGLTMDQMMELVKKYEGKPAVLAEVIGQDAINALTALTRTLGKTSQKAQDIIEERSYGWYDRAKGDIEEATGFAPGQVDDIVEQGMEAGREKARPFYEQLYSQFKDVKAFPESLKRVNRLLRSPGMERHKDLAEEAIRNASAKRSIPLSKMSKMEYFDLIKQSLDDAIDSAVAKGENRTRVGESVRDLTELKDEFVKELDRLTNGAYSAAREAGGEAPRLRQAAVEGQKAFGAKNPRVVEQTVQGTTPEALPALRAGMADDLATRIDKGSLIPGRFRRPDVANKTRAVFGEEAGDQLIGKMDAEATLRETGSRWAPRMNSVTGTVMESGPSQMGDEIMNAGMNLLTGNKLGLLRQAINFARQRGFSQRQLDSIGDLLLSNPEEGLRRLGRMRPDGTPSVGGQAAGAQNALAGPDGSGAISNPGNALAIGAGKAPSARPKGPVSGAGFMLPEKSGRPIGFHDDLPRGSKPFRSDKLTDSQNKAVEMARNGYSNAEIAEEMEITANAVSVHLRNARLRGVDYPASKTGKQPTTRTDILRAAESGAKATAIAERLGISPVQVRVTLSRARKAVKDAGRELPDWLKPQTAGIDAGSELSQLGVGTGIGAQGAQDLDGDGKISFAERAAGAAAGYGVIKGGPRAIAAARNSGGRVARGAGFAGKPPKPPKKRLGRGLDSLMDEAAPVRKPAQTSPVGNALEAKPRTGADWTEAERKAFINSGHEEGLIPIEPPSSFQTIKDARKSMKKLGIDTKAGTKNDYEGGFPVIASMLAAGGVTAGAMGLLAAYLNQKPKSNVPPELAKARAKLADEAATAYQNDPNGDEFRNTMIRIQQLDRKIEGGEASGEPSAPSYKPRRLSPSPAGITGDMFRSGAQKVSNALAFVDDKANKGAENAAGYVAERFRTAELPKRPIDLLKESEVKRNRKGQFMRDMDTKRKNDELWQRNGYTGYNGRKMTPEELRAYKGKGAR